MYKYVSIAELLVAMCEEKLLMEGSDYDPSRRVDNKHAEVMLIVQTSVGYDQLRVFSML